MGTFRHMIIVAFVCLLRELCELLSVSLIQYQRLRVTLVTLVTLISWKCVGEWRVTFVVLE